MIDNRIVKLEVDTEAFSKDLQTVETTLAINYRVDTAKSYSIYKNIDAKYEEVLVVPAVNEVLKAIVAQYTAEESVTNRSLISEGLVVGLNEKLNSIGLFVTDVNIINFDFSEAFITAIEKTNPGYKWDWDEKKLIGKNVIAVFGEGLVAVPNVPIVAVAVIFVGGNYKSTH